MGLFLGQAGPYNSETCFRAFWEDSPTFHHNSGWPRLRLYINLPRLFSGYVFHRFNVWWFVTWRIWRPGTFRDQRWSDQSVRTHPKIPTPFVSGLVIAIDPNFLAHLSGSFNSSPLTRRPKPKRDLAKVFYFKHVFFRANKAGTVPFLGQKNGNFEMQGRMRLHDRTKDLLLGLPICWVDMLGGLYAKINAGWLKNQLPNKLMETCLKWLLVNRQNPSHLKSCHTVHMHVYNRPSSCISNPKFGPKMFNKFSTTKKRGPPPPCFCCFTPTLFS